MVMKPYIYIYDTTLRDGAQTRGIDFSMQDKINIATRLNNLKVDYIEAGWNGANLTDTEIFQNLPIFDFSKVSSFGMTKRKVHDDKAFNELLKTPVSILTIVGKTWDIHVKEALGISLNENLNIIKQSIESIIKTGKECFFDAEHFFDGYKHNPQYALSCIRHAYDAGARWIILCDTNGGTLPFEIEQIISEVIKYVPGENLGIHCHNDTGNAVANTLMAVQAGVQHVQGTINGIGERCGNADLITIIPNLILKMGYRTAIKAENLKNLTSVSRYLYEMQNRTPRLHQPFVGLSAFAHKGGLHASAILKNPSLYEHVNPEDIGNRRKILISSQSGKSNIIYLLKNIGIDIDPNDDRVKKLLKILKEKEYLGYSYDTAQASFEVLVRDYILGLPEYFKLESFRVIDERRYNKKGNLTMVSDATIRVVVDGREYIEASDGNGPVDALANSLLKVLLPIYPKLNNFKLLDYRVRILETKLGTDATTRVIIDFGDDKGNRWSTVGISTDIIHASFQAVYDGVIYCLMK